MNTNFRERNLLFPMLICTVTLLVCMLLAHTLNVSNTFYMLLASSLTVPLTFYIRKSYYECKDKEALLPEFNTCYWNFLRGAFKNKLRETVVNSLNDRFPIEPLAHLRKNTGILYALALSADRGIEQVNRDVERLIENMSEELEKTKGMSVKETQVRLSQSLFDFHIKLNNRSIVEERIPKIFVVKQ